MHVLVTGGAGFIGSHVCEALLTRGDAVTVLDNFDPFYCPQDKWDNLEWCLDQKPFSLVEGDIRDEGAVGQLFHRADFDGVIHLAGFAGVRQSLADPIACEDINVRGTLVMLEAARRHSVNRFILASTSSAYGLSPAVPYREDDPLLTPVSPYGASKIAGEKYGHIYHAVHGLSVLSLRLFTAYGPRQRPDMAFRRFAAALLAGEAISVYGDGSTTRDYTYIADLVGGLLRAWDSNVSYGVFNLGSGSRYTLLETIQSLGHALGIEPRLEFLPEQAGDPPHTWADISLARAELDYAPRVPLEEGMQKLVAWLADRAR